MSLFSVAFLAAGLVFFSAGVVLFTLGRRSKGTRSSSERPRKTERASWLAGIVSMVASLASLAVGLVPDLSPGASTGVDGVPNPEGSVGQAPTGSEDPRGADAASHQDHPENGTQERQCRNDWSVMASGMAEYQACTALVEDGVALSARVRPTDLVADPVEVTVWLWLMDRDPDLIASEQFDLTRDASTLDSCRVTLSANDDVHECGPFVFQPSHEGLFATSGDVASTDRDFPRGWDNSGFAGTQGPAVRWPPAP